MCNPSKVTLIYKSFAFSYLQKLAKVLFQKSKPPLQKFISAYLSKLKLLLRDSRKKVCLSSKKKHYCKTFSNFFSIK